VFCGKGECPQISVDGKEVRSEIIASNVMFEQREKRWFSFDTINAATETSSCKKNGSNAASCTKVESSVSVAGKRLENKPGKEQSINREAIPAPVLEDVCVIVKDGVEGKRRINHKFF